VPYWTIDASMSVMTMLLAAEANGLGALFFGVFRGERELRQALGIPPGLELLGAIALGHPADVDPTPSVGVSTARRRRGAAEIIHAGGWRPGSIESSRRGR
jgi:nitroreductase